MLSFRWSKLAQYQAFLVVSAEQQKFNNHALYLGNLKQLSINLSN